MTQDVQQLKANIISTINELSLDQLQLLADYLARFTTSAETPNSKAEVSDDDYFNDPIWELGNNPIHTDDDITDASINHDKYIYTGL